MGKQVLLRDLEVVVKRLPFANRTNKLDMPIVKNVDKRCATSKKRYKKKTTLCRTCKCNSENATTSLVKKSKSNIPKSDKEVDRSTSSRSVTITKPTIKKLGDKSCHDAKYNANCKVLLEKMSNSKSVKSLSHQLSKYDAKFNVNCKVLLEKMNNSKSVKTSPHQLTNIHSKSVSQNFARYTDAIPELKINITSLDYLADNRKLHEEVTLLNEQNKNLSSKKSSSSETQMNHAKSTNTSKENNGFHYECRVVLDKANFIELTPLSDDDIAQLEDSNNVIINTNLNHRVTGNSNNLDLSKGLQKKSEQATSDDEQNKRLNPFLRKRLLRKQIKPNYAEITLDTSQDVSLNKPEPKVATKVPVYKQQIEDKKKKAPDNLYEFDESDSDKDKQKRKKKLLPRNKPRKVNQQRRGFKVLKNPSRKYKQIMQEIMQKAMEKVNDGNKPAVEGTVTSENIVRDADMLKILDTVNTSETDTGILKSDMHKYKLPQSNPLVLSMENLSKTNGNHGLKTVSQNSLVDSISISLSDNIKTMSESIKIHETLNRQGITQSNYERSAQQENLLSSGNANVRKNVTKQNTRQIICNTEAGRDSSGDIFPSSELEISIEGIIEHEIVDDRVSSTPDANNKENSDRGNRKTQAQQIEGIVKAYFDSRSVREIQRPPLVDITNIGHLELIDIPPKNVEIWENLNERKESQDDREEVWENLNERKESQVDREPVVGENNSEDLFPSELEISTENVIVDDKSRENLSPSSNEENDVEDIAETDYENRSEQDIDDSFLNFNDQGAVSPLKTIPKVNVISDVILRRKDLQRNDNKVLPGHKQNPWRFSEYVKRNPHFIILKTTALPCLKQDMVLDHSQVEKIEEHFSKTPRRVETPKRSPVQKSILDYVNVPGSEIKENHPRSSLFDYDDFSPIKTKPSKEHDLRNKVKRNILAPIQNYALNTGPFTSTPTKSNTKRVSFNATAIENKENEDILNYFGFDDDEVPTSKGIAKSSLDKPYRINGNVHKKHIKEVAETEELEENLPVQEPSESQAELESMDVQLFEDPEKNFTLNVPSKIYQRKTRRKRLKSVEAENDEKHPKKRKKDMMTKAEEVELENWAAKFNSMCAEIEKYNLEIE